MSRLIVSIGGNTRPDSSTERVLGLAADAARCNGAEVKAFGGVYMAGLPHYRGPDWSPDKGREMIEAVRAFNPDIKILIDGSQGIVHGAVNVTALDCDFYVFTGHKLYGPTGVGVLYGRADILNAMPPYQGGGDMIDHVTFDKTTYKDAPARFEAGTPAIVEVIGLGAAIDYVAQIGMTAIAAQETKLFAYALGRLQDVPGLKLYGPLSGRRAGIMSFTAEWGHPSDIAMILDQCGVAVRSGHHCCQPLMQRFGVDATLRASLGLYSNESDIDSLVNGLLKAKELLS